MKKILLPLLIATTLCGCYTDNEEDLYPVGACDLTAVTFSKTVQPIINANCAISGCHAGATPANGMNFETYAGVKAVATSGDLIGAINHSSGFSAMPQGQPKLAQCSLDQIADWVTKGALNN